MEPHDVSIDVESALGDGAREHHLQPIGEPLADRQPAGVQDSVLVSPLRLAQLLPDLALRLAVEDDALSDAALRTHVERARPLTVPSSVDGPLTFSSASSSGHGSSPRDSRSATLQAPKNGRAFGRNVSGRSGFNPESLDILGKRSSRDPPAPADAD